MDSQLGRAGGFGLCSLIAVTIAAIDAWTIVVFLVVGAAAFLTTEGPLFEALARPGDREAGQLRSMSAFALSGALLGGFVVWGTMPAIVFGGTMVLVGGGLVGRALAVEYADLSGTVGYLAGGIVGAGLGQLGVMTIYAVRLDPGVLGNVVLLAVAGGLVGALVRSMLFVWDDPPVLFSVAIVLWLLAIGDVATTPVAVGLAIGVTAVVGGLSHALGTASIEGLIAGTAVILLAIALGGWGWFALLFAFFAIGGLSTKYRYEQKADYGVAQENEGARGGENVIANSAAAVGVLSLFALAEAGSLPGDPILYQLAFGGAVATALADTLSSEVGGAYDGTRLITTMEPVPPGTDGGVTWQGGLAGLAGGAIIAGLLFVLWPGAGLIGAAVVVIAGVAGMTVDSLLGATVEGEVLGNESVNFLATVAGALVGAVGLLVV